MTGGSYLLGERTIRILDLVETGSGQPELAMEVDGRPAAGRQAFIRVAPRTPAIAVPGLFLIMTRFDATGELRWRRMHRIGYFLDGPEPLITRRPSHPRVREVLKATRMAAIAATSTPTL